MIVSVKAALEIAIASFVTSQDGHCAQPTGAPAKNMPYAPDAGAISN